MRGLAYLAIVVGCLATGSAGAQTLILSTPVPSEDRSTASALADAAFAPRSPKAAADPIGRLMEREAYKSDAGLVRWNSGELQLSNGGTGPIDSLRVSVGGEFRTPGGVPTNLDRAQFQADAYEVALVREWPKALTFAGRSFAVDLSPHAGVGVTNYGGSAEAGAKVKISRDERAARKLKEMGLGDGAAFGDMGRWYLYGAVNGRAVGLNMMRNDGGWDRAGWTTDSTSELMGDVQLGVGFRKGVMQSSLGIIHREVKGTHMIWGQQTRDDSMVAFSLSIKPQR